MAARAVETLARLMTNRGLLDEAVYYYRLLGQRVCPRAGSRRQNRDRFSQGSVDRQALLALPG